MSGRDPTAQPMRSTMYQQRERELEQTTKEESQRPRRKPHDQRMKVTSRLGQNQRNTRERVDLNDLTLNPIQTPQGGSRTKNDHYARPRNLAQNPKPKDWSAEKFDWITRVEEKHETKARHLTSITLRHGWTSQGRATSYPWNAQAQTTCKYQNNSSQPRRDKP